MVYRTFHTHDDTRNTRLIDQVVHRQSLSSPSPFFMLFAYKQLCRCKNVTIPYLHVLFVRFSFR